MSGDALRNMRGNQEPRPVVKVNSILGNDPPVQEEPPLETKEPVQEQMPAKVEEFDLNALLQFFPDEEGEEEEGEKLTFYLKPHQFEKLNLICSTYSTKKGKPENYQQVLRYVLETFSLEQFAGMPTFVREKKMDRLKALGQRRLKNLMKSLKAKSRKITGE